MPSYEDEDGGFVVYDLMVCQGESNGSLMALSRFYGVVCLIAPEDLTALHHSPQADWVYRPLLYRRNMYGSWDRLGSQMELGWRYGLGKMQLAMAAIDDGEEFDPQKDFSMPLADERADKLLGENLTPLQSLELSKSDSFRVRGGKTKSIYVIELGNGFKIVNGMTGDTGVSYCLHPDYWMPMADVALATKLQLEDPEMEEETTENARATVYYDDTAPTREQAWAYKLEKELIA